MACANTGPGGMKLLDLRAQASKERSADICCYVIQAWQEETITQKLCYCATHTCAGTPAPE